MVSQFLRLTEAEQFKIVNSNPKLINSGTIFLRGEQIESEESRRSQQQRITTDHLEYRGSGIFDDEAMDDGTTTTATNTQEDDHEMYMEEDIEEEESEDIGELSLMIETSTHNGSINKGREFPELLNFPEDEDEIRNKIIEKNLAPTEEIVDAIKSILLELNMQVS